MAVETVVESAQEVVSLASTLEAQETETDTEVVENTAVEGAVEGAAEVVKEKIEQAVESGASKEEVNELRAMLRSLRNDNISLQARLLAAERVQKGEFGTEGGDIQPTEFEVANSKLQEVSGRDFSQILAVMEVNPKYEDLSEVCSVNNFSDIFESVAQYRSQNNSSDFNLELVKVQAEVWGLPNPYKYMYELIKEHHPKYAAKEETQPTKAAKAETAKETLANKAAKAPGSIANIPGSSNSAVSGWTAERIDSLSESELHTVPRDIYKKWLNGELN